MIKITLIKVLLPDMIAKIAPNRRFQRGKGVFDYLIPDHLITEAKIGRRVIIPFRSSEIEGIIYQLIDKTEVKYKLKPIVSILPKELALTDQQIELAKWMSDYYLVSPANILSSMLPHVPKRSIEQKAELNISKSNGSLTIKKKYLNELQEIINDSADQSLLVWQDYSAAQTLITLMLKKASEIEQILLIFPTYEKLNNFVSTMSSQIRNKSIIYSQSLNKATLFDYWQKIKGGQVNIILGTRSALFLPFHNLNKVIMVDEESEEYKQADQNPRYHASEVAEKLANLNRSKLLLLSSTPSIQSVVQYKFKQVFKLTSISPKIIDLSNFQSLTKNRLVSQQLLDFITNTIKNKTVLLYLNRLGYSTSVICKDCSYVKRCPHCQLPLTENQDNSFRCNHCKYKEDMINVCPECNGSNLISIGSGIEKIEDFLKTNLPNNKIIRFEKGSDIPNLDQPTIIIGTKAMLSTNWPQDKIGLISVLSADTLFNLADFRSTEKTWQLLNHLSVLANQFSAQYVVQTHSIENNVIKYLSTPGKFYDEEIKSRQSFGYPPFKTVIKLIVKDVDENSANKRADTLFKNLRQKVVENIEVLPPYPAHSKKVRESYIWNIVIKLSPDEYPEKLNSLLDLISPDVLIDVNPDNLL